VSDKATVQKVNVDEFSVHRLCLLFPRADVCISAVCAGGIRGSTHGKRERSARRQDDRGGRDADPAVGNQVRMDSGSSGG